MTPKKTSIIRFFLLTLAFISVSGFATEADIHALIQQETENFSSRLQAVSGEELEKVAHEISGSGNESTELYEQIKNMLSERLDTLANVKDKKSKRAKQLGNEATALIIALASSGDPANKITLDDIAVNAVSGGIRRRAEWSKDKLNWYASRNSLMNDFDKYNPQISLFENRVINALSSDDFSVSRYIMEHMHRTELTSPAILDYIEELLLSGYETASSSTEKDLIAWYARTLGKFDKEKYRASLTTVLKSGVSEKIKRHVRKALK